MLCIFVAPIYLCLVAYRKHIAHGRIVVAIAEEGNAFFAALHKTTVLKVVAATAALAVRQLLRIKRQGTLNRGFGKAVGADSVVSHRDGVALEVGHRGRANDEACNAYGATVSIEGSAG